jgi:hypothetical protein
MDHDVVDRADLTASSPNPCDVRWRDMGRIPFARIWSHFNASRKYKL